MIQSRIYSILKYALLIFTAIFLLWLLNLNFPRNRVLSINLDFFRDQKITSKIGPGDRLKNQDGQAIIIDNPVYFDLRFLPWFDQARVILVYRPNGRVLQGVGYQVGPGFNFSVIKPISEKSVGNDFWEATFIIDLNQVYKSRNVTRFLIETKADTLDQGGNIVIKSLKINLLR